MKLKVRAVKKWPGYKIVGVEPATKEEKAALFKFCKDILGLDITRMPLKNDLVTGKWFDKNWMFPPVRCDVKGRALTLIPDGEHMPCEICQFAQYNAACLLSKKCVPYIYWMFDNLTQLPAVGEANA